MNHLSNSNVLGEAVFRLGCQPEARAREKEPSLTLRARTLNGHCSSPSCAASKKEHASCSTYVGVCSQLATFGARVGEARSARRSRMEPTTWRYCLAGKSGSSLRTSLVRTSFLIRAV